MWKQGNTVGSSDSAGCQPVPVSGESCSRIDTHVRTLMVNVIPTRVGEHATCALAARRSLTSVTDLFRARSLPGPPNGRPTIIGRPSPTACRWRSQAQAGRLRRPADGVLQAEAGRSETAGRSLRGWLRRLAWPGLPRPRCAARTARRRSGPARPPGGFRPGRSRPPRRGTRPRSRTGHPPRRTPA